MIKTEIKGKIIQGTYSPNGEVMVVEGTDKKGLSYYYIYIWPNDGTKWPDTDKDMIYDYWLESWHLVESFFEDWEWEVEWYAEDDPRNDVVKHLNPDSGV